MKIKGLFYFLALIVFFSLSGCGDSASSESNNSTDVTEDVTIDEAVVPQPTFEVSIRRSQQAVPQGFPFLHSTAFAQQGSQVLFIGGRTAGFHGISPEQEPFKSTRANASIWVVDFVNFAVYELPLEQGYPDLMQFQASNFASHQDQDTLFIAGGYGAHSLATTESDTTHRQMLAIQVSAMIEEVKKGAAGNPRNAIIKGVKTPFVQVSGGELIRADGVFYLFFGQNYEGKYLLSRQGNYTNAVRQFRWDGAALTDTASIIAPNLHRRDLNVMRVEQSGDPFFVGYGGVFNKDDGGFLKPIYISTENGQLAARENQDIIQKTNNYQAATVSIYDAVRGVNTHVIMGGIGQYQYDAQSGQWEEGDNGAPLPFVKTITQMIWSNGFQTQYVQLPPTAPELPELLGANAAFIPSPSFLYSPGVIDYNKLGAGETSIGWFYGGIKSQKPTSSMIYPTSINNTIYEVIVTKNPS